MKNRYYVHPTSVLDSDVKIGTGTKIWHFCHISSGAVLGKNCTLGQNVYIGENVMIGNNVKIQNNVSIYQGVRLMDNVFCGPSCVFTNVLRPRSEYSVNKRYDETLVGKGVTIGANATIICGTKLGKYSFVGAGSVVTKDVKPYHLVYGNPAKDIGIIDNRGKRI